MNKNAKEKEQSDNGSEEEDEIYEQDEVIWAKIKGYPWWPAYIRTINEENSDDEIEYTVHFFGDNTHSRLGAAKIRKFLQKYPEFYRSVKDNRKLKQAIFKAEQKLKENGQNVQMFDDIRSQMRGKKRARKNGCRTDSKIDSSDHNNVFDTPELNKMHTNEARIQRRSSEFEVEQSEEKEQYKASNPRIQQQSLSEQLADETKRKPVRGKSSIKFEPINQNIIHGKTRSRRRREVSPFKQKTPQPSESEDQQNDEEKQAGPPNKQVSESAQSSSSESQSRPKRRPYIRRGGFRRGKRRARRIVAEAESQELISSAQGQSDKKTQKQRPARNIRGCGRQKIIKPLIEQERPKSNLNLTVLELPGATEQIPQNIRQNILERVKFCLTNRDQLIETLMRIPVTTQNIKEILDLGVIDIIKAGQITSQIRFLLQCLKSVLLYKYFPEDAKIRKKHDKIIKKRITLNNCEERKIDQEHTLSNEDLQIRKKTIKKLEKIIRGEGIENSKDYARQIELHFRRKDPIIGDGYRDLAYRILRNLKDKTESFEKVLARLQADQYE